MFVDTFVEINYTLINAYKGHFAERTTRLALISPFVCMCIT